MENVKNFLCIKWGTKYGSEYVNRLYNAVSKNVTGEFRFACLTENTDGLDKGVETFPLPKTGFDEKHFDTIAGGETWRKVGLFMPNITDLQGDTVFLDLDVVIMGNLDSLFTYAPNSFVVIQDWLEKRRGAILPWRDGNVGNTSVFRFNPQLHYKAFDYFKKNTQVVLEKFRIEQQYVSWVLKSETAFWPEKWVQSFKRSCRPVFPLNLIITPKEPENVKVLVFHGHPLPQEAIEGYKKSAFKYVRPTNWIEKYWK